MGTLLLIVLTCALSAVLEAAVIRVLTRPDPTGWARFRGHGKVRPARISAGVMIDGAHLLRALRVRA